MCTLRAHIQFSNGTLELIMSVNGQYAQNYLQLIICKRIHFSKEIFVDFIFYGALSVIHSLSHSFGYFFLFILFFFVLFLVIIMHCIRFANSFFFYQHSLHPFFFRIKGNSGGLIYKFFIALFLWTEYWNLFGFDPIFTLMRIVFKYIDENLNEFLRLHRNNFNRTTRE